MDKKKNQTQPSAFTIHFASIKQMIDSILWNQFRLANAYNMKQFNESQYFLITVAVIAAVKQNHRFRKGTEKLPMVFKVHITRKISHLKNTLI